MTIAFAVVGVVESQSLDAKEAAGREGIPARAARLKAERWQDSIGDGRRPAVLADCDPRDVVTISHNVGSLVGWNRFCYGRDNEAGNRNDYRRAAGNH